METVLPNRPRIAIRSSAYVWSMQLHNVGVIAIFGSLAIFLYLNHLPSPYCLLLVIAACFWIYDFVWLLSRQARAEHAAVISQPE
jgi:hypothetical protein